MKIKLPAKTTYFGALLIVAGALLYWPAKEMVQPGYPKAFSLLEKEGFTLCYDGKNRVPLWTWEQLDTSQEKTVSRKSAHFATDPEVYSAHKSSTLDYKNSGYDRGHLSPAQAHTHSAKGMKDSFLLSNICPMSAQFNRGIWKDLENYTFALSRQGLLVTVISGPLFLEQQGHITYELLGQNRVAIPTHFFKVVQTKSEAGKTNRQVFIIDAHNPPQHLFKDKANKAFHPDIVTTLEHLENVSGIVFKRDF